MYMYKNPFFSLSFCELIAHADLVWDFLIINLVVFQSLGTDTVPSLKSWVFFFGIMFYIPLYLELDGVLSLSSRYSS